MSDATPIIIKKKKGHGGHAHHGGSWKVAYADFVTAMMAFFMVMWIMGLSDDTKTQVQGYFNDPLGFKNSMQRSHDVVPIKGTIRSRAYGSSQADAVPGKAEESTMKTLAAKLKAQLEQGKGDLSLKQLMKDVEITVTPEGLKVDLVESTDADFFELGSATLSPSAELLIKRIAPVLGRSGRTMIVEGHTDSVPYPSASYSNWDLSSDRANALRRALTANGVNLHQFTGVRALADTQPKLPNDPRNSRNRRVSLLLPFKTVGDERVELPKDELQSRLTGDGAIKPASPLR